MDDCRRQLPLLGRRLPPWLAVREIGVAPRSTRAYDETEWRDTLVVVTRGEIELECLGGSCRRFERGDVLWLVGLPLRAIHNRGPGPARLLAVSRRA